MDEARHKRALMLFLEFIKYTYVSALALVVDYSTYWLTIKHTNIGLSIAAAMGYTVGLCVAYFLMINFVFKDGWLRKRRAQEATMFAASGILGVLSTYATVIFYLNMVDTDPIGAKNTAVFSSFLMAYIFRKTIVFGDGNK